MKFKTGLIAGTVIGVLGVAGMGYTLSDNQTKKKIARKSRRALEKASDVLDNFADKI